jgi:hypothetical protein
MEEVSSMNTSLKMVILAEEASLNIPRNNEQGRDALSYVSHRRRTKSACAQDSDLIPLH